MTMLTIFELVPELDDDRDKRAPVLDFVSTIGKTLFGFAKQEDVQLVARHINILTREFNKMNVQYARDQGNFASVLNQVDGCLSEVTQFMTETRNMTEQVILAMTDAKTKWLILEELILNQTQWAAEIRSRLNKLSVAITTLVHGSIPPFLVKPTQMEKMITLINDELKREHPLYKLAVKDPRFYYDYKNFIFARKGSNLFLTIKFLITAHNNYKLYKIKTFYVPLNQTSVDAIMLMNQPDYFIISEEQSLMTVASQPFIDKCNKGQLKLCTETITFTAVDQSICLSEIYFENNLTLIHSLCDYRYFNNVITSHILEISPTEVLLYRVKQLSMNCQGKQVNTTGCSFCQKVIGCQCSLTNSVLSYTGHISFCNEDNTVIETYFPVNLGVLANFFNHAYLTTLMKNVSFQDPIKVLIPKFNIYKHDVSKLLQMIKSVI